MKRRSLLEHDKVVLGPGVEGCTWTRRDERVPVRGMERSARRAIAWQDATIRTLDVLGGVAVQGGAGLLVKRGYDVGGENAKRLRAGWG